MSEQEVDAPVEDQTDQTTSALALVLAETLLQARQTGGDETDPAMWLPTLRSSAGIVLLAYLMATTRPFVESTGVDPASVAGPLREAAAKASEGAVARAAQVLAASAPDLSALPSMEQSRQARTDAGVAARSMVVGAREMMRYDLGPVLGAVYKVWRTRQDAVVRPTHAGLEGNRIPITNEFITMTGNSLRFPGDPLAPLAETAGCRCRLSYVVPKGSHA